MPSLASEEAARGGGRGEERDEEKKDSGKKRTGHERERERGEKKGLSQKKEQEELKIKRKKTCSTFSDVGVMMCKTINGPSCVFKDGRESRSRTLEEITPGPDALRSCTWPVCSRSQQYSVEVLSLNTLTICTYQE